MAQQLLGGRYRLREVLGQGGMATVWRADDLHLHRPVAVKVLEPAMLTVPGVRGHLEREARILARLTHPNIVAVHDFDVESEPAYMVLELVEGWGLGTVLARGGLPTVERAVGIAVQVCDALAAAHAAGIQHRDIKPGNIIVTPDGVVKVCDFGIAGPDDGTVLSGTSEYIAPERAAGAPGDARSDLYALGCVLYAMLSGGPPFTGPTPTAVLRQHLHDVPVALARQRDGIPAALDRLVLDLLDKDPDRRPPSAEAVRERLTASIPTAVDQTAVDVAGLPVDGSPAALARPARRVGGHRALSTLRDLRWALVALAVLVVSGGILAVLPELTGSPAGPPVHDRGTAAGASAADRPSGPPDASPSPAPLDQPSASASGPPAPVPPPAPSRSATLVDQFTVLQTVIAQQVNAGQLDRDAAAELTDRLQDVARRLGKGQTSAAGSRLARVRQNLAGLVQDGKLTTGGFQAVSAALDRFAGAVARVQNA